MRNRNQDDDRFAQLWRASRTAVRSAAVHNAIVDRGTFFRRTSGEGEE
jgi:hypothetical protein